MFNVLKFPLMGLSPSQGDIYRREGIVTNLLESYLLLSGNSSSTQSTSLKKREKKLQAKREDKFRDAAEAPHSRPVLGLPGQSEEGPDIQKLSVSPWTNFSIDLTADTTHMRRRTE